VFPCAANFPNIGMSSDLTNSGYVQFNSPQQMVSYGGLDTVINPPYMGLKRNVSVPETYLHSSSFTVGFTSLYLFLVVTLLNDLNLISFFLCCSNCFPPQHGKVISKTFAIWILIKCEPHLSLLICPQVTKILCRVGSLFP